MAEWDAECLAVAVFETASRSTPPPAISTPSRDTNSKLLDVVNNELATGGLDDTPAVRGRVVGLALAESDTLGHSVMLARSSWLVPLVG